jgi:2Fe-2S ferredoxin
VPRVVFITPNGARRELDVEAGKTVLEIAWENGIDIEGACEGSLACSTCHVIVAERFFDRLPPATDDEEDMLDLAWGVRETSRLGCQIVVTEELDGIELTLPLETINHMED